jgi:3-oxoacyl-[acyl-carrier protein] reductase
MGTDLGSNLKGKSVIITGGSRGIGRAAALEFARAGANVAFTYEQNHDAAKSLAHELEVLGMRAMSRAVQVTDEAQMANFMDDIIGEFGSLDVAVANAGIWKEARIAEMTQEEFREMMEINMTGSFVLAKLVAQRMMPKKRGAIVLVSSTAGQRGESEHSHYAASKGAQISFVKSLAVELAPWNIRVNAVAPGWVETDMTMEALALVGEKIKAQMPFGRAARAEEIARPIVFLASDAASFITGEVLNVNGGSVLCG